jgi:two-component system response regulator AtoC
MGNKAKYTIFSVEDDIIYRRLIQHRISLDHELEVLSFPDTHSAFKEIEKNPNILILDLNLPDYSGIELIHKFQEILPNCLIIVLSAQEKIETVVEVLKSGVYDYIHKDDYALDRVWLSTHNAIKQIELNKEVEVLRSHVKEQYSFSENIKGVSPEMRSIFRLMEKTVTNNIPVEITGETGTGKELVAKAIHFNSLRKKHPFIALNVAAFPKELVESELFGHEKGSFTGAILQKTGKLEEANGGTLFLDEISEMDHAMQAKLLRAIQEMEISRIGSNKLIKLNFRIIIATHKNLLNEVKEGRFREDLYYRLLGLKIELPPLRKRGNDVLLLSNHFLNNYCKLNKIENKTLNESAKKGLLNYTFPGNVRELKAIIETGCIMSDTIEIDLSDLQLPQEKFLEKVLSKTMSLESYTIQIIDYHLKKNDFNVLQTAKDLDIGKTTIYRYIKEGKIKIVR